MEYPWIVVGWEKTISDKGTAGCRLYLEQPLVCEREGEGMATQRVWFNPEHIAYTPKLDQKIIIITEDRNRNIVSRIIVVA